MTEPFKDKAVNKEVPVINISIVRSPHREPEGDFWRRTGYSISAELFSNNHDDPTRRIVYDSIMNTFEVEEYNLENEQNRKEVINKRQPNDWEILSLVEQGVEALTTPGFLKKESYMMENPREIHIHRLIHFGKEKVREDAQTMLNRVKKIEKTTPFRRNS